MTILESTPYTPPENCPICFSTALSTHYIAAEVERRKGLAFNFTFCKSCGFVNNPQNTYDNWESGFLKENTPNYGTRAGDGITPRREYRMSEMALKIRNAIEEKSAPALLIYGAGISKDHDLIRSNLRVQEVIVTDIENFQKTSHFINLDSDRKFDIVIASEVVEHFTDIYKNFENLLSKTNDDGIIILGTNIHDGCKIAKIEYPYSPGHTSYYTGDALLHIARHFGLKIDFRTPAVGGPRKRYVLLFKDPAYHERIAHYFASHHIAPAEI